MAGKSYDGRPLEPIISDEQRALIPDVSGNDINGLGEAHARRPTPVYWGNPKSLAHGAMQSWMLEQCNRGVPEVSQLMTGFGGRGPEERAPVNDRPAPGEPPQFSQSVKDFALNNEADAVGITGLDPNWVFEGEAIDHPWVIVLALIMDHAELAAAPEPPSVIEVMRQYNRGTRAARALADWIRGQGFQADPHGGPTRGPLTMIPAAIAAGLGELGKHGSIINDEFGASFRLACVTTDMPLVADAPNSFGVDDFCLSCKLCTDSCPPDAIFETKQMVRGENKWYVDFDRCVPYFNETYGCGICIAVCPWSRPGVAPRLTKKMAAKSGR